MKNGIFFGKNGKSKKLSPGKYFFIIFRIDQYCSIVLGQVFFFTLEKVSIRKRRIFLKFSKPGIMNGYV